MATPSVLTFDAEGRAVDFEVWVDDLQLFLQCDRADGLSLFDLTSGASPAPPATADSTIRSQWATRDAAARLAVRRHLPTTERAHFSQYKSAQTLYDAVVARYFSPSTAALSRLILPYLFPDLAAFPTVADLITHLRTSDTRYCTALPAEFCAQNPPPMYITLYYIVTRLPDSLRLVRDHFLSVCPTTLTVDLLKQRLLAAETSIVAVGASRGDPRTPVFEGSSPSPLLPSVAFVAAADLGGFESVGAASAPSGRSCTGRGKGGKGTGGTGGGGGGGGGGSGGGWGGGGRGGGGGGDGSSSGGGGGGGGGGGSGGGGGGGGGRGGGGSGGAGRGSTQRSGSGGGGGTGPCTYVLRTGDRAGEQYGGLPSTQRCFGHLTDAWRHQFPDAIEIPRWGDLSRAGVAIFDLDYYAILAAMYAVSTSDEGDCYLCLPPHPGGEAAALGACEATAPGADAVVPVEVAVDSGAARGAEPVGAGSGGAESGGAKPGGAESRGAEPGGAEPGGAESGGAEPGGADRAAGAGDPPVAPGPGGARPGGTGAVGTWGAAAAAGVGPAGASGAAGAGAAGGVGAGFGAAGASGAAGAGAAGVVGAGVAGGAAGTGAANGGTSAVPLGTGGPVRPRPYFVPLLEQVLGLPPSPGPAPPLECLQPVQSQSQLQHVSPLPAPSPYAGPTGGLAECREPASRPASPVRTSRRTPRPRPPAVPGTHQMTLRPSTAPLRVPLPSPPASSLPVLADPASDSLRAASPTVTRLLSTIVTDPSFEYTAASALVAELVDFAARYRLVYAASLVAESAFVCPPSVGGECALSTDILEDRQEEFLCFAAALPHLVSTLIAPEGDPDAPDIPTPRSYAEAIEGPYSSQWQSAMDAEMASWKSTGTYVDEVPPPGTNIVSGMWIFRVKRPLGSPPVFKARYVAQGFSQRQGLHSLDFSTAFLQGSLHEEIWLRRPPGFTGSFPPGTQWSLQRPVYGLRQAPREWHNTLRTTLAALGFAPSTADPSLFLRTDTSLPPFYILVAQGTITLTQSHMVQHVLQRFDFTYSSPQATPLSTRHSLSALPSDESVESNGPYPELVGCLMYLMTCTRPDLAYPLSILARYVAPGRHRPEHMAAAKRVLRYLCCTSGLGLVLGGRRPLVLTCHADASWADDQATQRSSQGYTFSLGSGSVLWRSTRSSSVLGSSCEAEIYAGAMAAQELRWLTYLLTDLGEPPRSPPVLYVDNKAMLALCREHRLEHRTKHIALHYFLARELQQRGQLRLAYVASEVNTADIFTKALPLGDHQRFCTMLGLVPTWPHLLTS
ncbi:unnamed protein product [Closterium sp. NIES-54]